jgi:hypothetical protein
MVTCYHPQWLNGTVWVFCCYKTQCLCLTFSLLDLFVRFIAQIVLFLWLMKSYLTQNQGNSPANRLGVHFQDFDGLLCLSC